MSEYDNEVEDFDINDPSFADLEGYVPDIDTTDVPKQSRPAPPSDGYHWVRARLANRDGGPVYIKGTRTTDGRVVDGKVIAAIDCHILNKETGNEGSFLKTLYASTMVFKGQRGSQLTAICYLAGRPVKAGSSLVAIKNHVEQIFAEAGDEGIELLVKTRWIKSVPQVSELKNPDGSGTEIFQYVLDGAGNKIYDEMKGEKRIKAAMLKLGVPEEQAHLYRDPVADEERSVQAEVQAIEDPSLLT